MNSPEALAGEIMGRIDQLAAISETPGALTRRYLTEEHRRANQLVGEWMSGAGMNAAQDAAGNMVGRYGGANDNSPALIIGSHLDTVVNAGKFDGMLGVQLQDYGYRFYMMPEEREQPMAKLREALRAAFAEMTPKNDE